MGKPLHVIIVSFVERENKGRASGFLGCISRFHEKKEIRLGRKFSPLFSVSVSIPKLPPKKAFSVLCGIFMGT